MSDDKVQTLTVKRSSRERARGSLAEEVRRKGASR